MSNKIYVASLRQGTFHSELSLNRKYGQSIHDYIAEEVEFRIDLILENIIFATKNKDKSCPLFFTLPEFFWNVKWSALRNKDELYQLTDYMQNHLSDAQEKLMNALPERQVGKIVLLAGTVAVLTETDCDGVFESLNYCLISNNFRKTKDGRFEKSMWPKRTTSQIDFGVRDKTTDNGFIFTLSDGVTLEVLNQTQYVGEHDAKEGYGLSVDNKMIEDCPFSINLCLDYMDVKPGERQSEVLEKLPKIDFLLACGMAFNPYYEYLSCVKFAVRNDGMGDGSVDYASVCNNKLFEGVPYKYLTPTLTIAQFLF